MQLAIPAIYGATATTAGSRSPKHGAGATAGAAPVELPTPELALLLDPALTEEELAALDGELEWDLERYGVGVATVDAQHRRLVELINALLRAFRIGAMAAAAGSSDGHHGGILPGGGSATLGAASQFNDDSVMAAALHPALGPARRAAGAPLFDHHCPPALQRGSAVHQLLCALAAYCHRTLAQEDMLLETYGFGDRVAHSRDHALFATEVQLALRRCEGHGLEPADLARLLAFLRRWMREHIPKDRRFAPLLLERDV